VASNLTGGLGGAGDEYTDADWVRAIRYGVGPDGKPLLFMPSGEFWYLSDYDLGAVIAFVKSQPAVDNELPGNQVALVLRAFYLLTGGIPLLAPELIDLEAPRPAAPEPGVTEEYGRYLAVSCVGCHGEGFSGGPIPGAPPDWPPAMNLTPGGELAGWTEAQFIQVMRTGVTPSGHAIENEYMPWKTIAKMTDNELKALFLFLQSLPAREFGNR
jgi:mono/diheme cytochrome c family protein